jgi:N utilization substance protein A
LAQAIGREGQNIRLASKMIDKEIDVFGDDEFNAMTDEQKAKILLETPSETLSAEGEQQSDGVGTEETAPQTAIGAAEKTDT